MRFDDWNNDELYHHGIKGQKWGIRRYQNPDGSLTDAGKARYTRGPNGDFDRYNFNRDINQRNPLSVKSRAARSILKNEVNKQDDLRNLTSNLKNGKRNAVTIRAEKAIDKFLRKKFKVEYVKESQENATTQMARKLVQDIVRDNRWKVDSNDELNRLTFKDHLNAAVIGTLAGPFAATSYTTKRLTDERKKK